MYLLSITSIQKGVHPGRPLLNKSTTNNLSQNKKHKKYVQERLPEPTSLQGRDSKNTSEEKQPAPFMCDDNNQHSNVYKLVQ